MDAEADAEADVEAEEAADAEAEEAAVNLLTLSVTAHDVRLRIK